MRKALSKSGFPVVAGGLISYFDLALPTLMAVAKYTINERTVIKLVQA
jgi:hypothetical protein